MVVGGGGSGLLISPAVHMGSVFLGGIFAIKNKGIC